CWSQSVIFHRSKQKQSIISNSPSLPRWHDSNKRVSEKPGAVQDGKLWFLEINPNGQWAWIENQTGYPIAAAIVDELESIKNGLV
ncbi:hypothetical protein NLO85_26790, partial [Pseudomonas savastanoi]|nr:hypothetical protein [Pseudomonas savastanoi]